MIAVDANLLIRWLDGQLNGTFRVGLPWSSLLAFVRLVSNPKLFPGALSVREAWEQVETWLALPSVWIPVPMERHPEILGSLLRLPGIKSNSVPDAHLAALAIEHDLTLCSSDGGFSGFAGLRWKNPI